MKQLVTTVLSLVLLASPAASAAPSSEHINVENQRTTAIALSPSRDSATAGGPTATRGHWEFPLRPAPAKPQSKVLRAFDPPPKPWMAGHRGVDLRAEQDSVYAPEAGVVTFRGTVVDRPVITIDHGGGLRSSFEPVESSLAVGSAVSKGQLIGTVNTGHCALTLCVHWGVRQDDVYQDPMSFIVDQRPSVLLPLG